MSFTYDVSDLSTDLAKVRLRLGDTVDLTSKNESLHDEEIQSVLSAITSLPGATLRCAKLLLARLRVQVDHNNAGVSASVSQKFQQLLELIDELKDEVKTGSTMVAVAGGLSKTRQSSNRTDSDYIQPAFEVGQDDKEGAAGSEHDESRCPD